MAYICMMTSMAPLQNFQMPAAEAALDRVGKLRAELERTGLSGFLVPKHEASPPDEERLAWLLGFTGSMGLGAIAGGRAALFVDGRYVLQAREQVADKAVEQGSLTRKHIASWLGEALKEGNKLGYDPWSHNVGEAAWLARVCRKIGAELVACESNPLDALWANRPSAPSGIIRAHPLEYAGRESSAKINDIAAGLEKRGLDAVVLDRGDSIAWLLNVRSMDAPHTPIVLSRVILSSDGSLDWFVPSGRLGESLPDALPSKVRVRAVEDFAGALKDLKDRKVALDRESAADGIRLHLENAGARLSFGDDPCQLPKACKNPVEQDGARAAHVRDGVALCRFLAWLDDALENGSSVDEIGAVKKLEAFRLATGHLQDISFDTIAGSGPHGAMMHYRVSESSNRRLCEGELFLVDSGGQYLDGTTDVTRTIAVGAPNDEVRRNYSLVLKGYIALAQARFPEGTTGAQLDGFARRALWAAGLDYNHGTGHGVGSFLDVHEGPARISKGGGDVALCAGMILSNEPGYYRDGAYGIRIESLVLVTPEQAIEGGDREMLGFEVLTLAPFDSSLINVALLDAGEHAFVDAYHQRVREIVSPLLEDERERAWLEKATRAL